MSKTKQFFTGLLNNVLFGIKTSFAASKFYFSLKLIILLSSTAVPLINIWLWKEVLNGIVEYEKAGKTVIIRALKKVCFSQTKDIPFSCMSKNQG